MGMRFIGGNTCQTKIGKKLWCANKCLKTGSLWEKCTCVCICKFIINFTGIKDV